MVSQLVLVPVYLSYWNVETYGVWIAIQALVSILSTLDQGHQTFLEFEFLKSGKERKGEIVLNLWSSIWIASGIGLLEIMLVAVLVLSGLTDNIFGVKDTVDHVLPTNAGYVLLMQMCVWTIFSNLGGVFVRVLSPFGYYARMSWWGVWAAVVSSAAPVIGVIFGADLFQAGIILAIATIGYAIPQYIDIFFLLKKENIRFERGSIRRGLQNFGYSLVISAKSLLENARQQGVRIILSPLAGAAGLVAFSTMRTGANIVLQGLNTITSPLMPELMRFLNQKDQQKMEMSFSMVWLVVLLLLTPGVILLQAFIGPLFIVWTKGQVPFDPLLFSLLSLGVLVFAVAQPSMAVMRGNNLLRPQLIIAIISATIVIGGMLALVPVWGIKGAGVALLSGEIAATTGYRITAKKWLRDNGLRWPTHSSRLALSAVWVAAATMCLMLLFPSLRGIWCIAGLLITATIAFFYWRSLPPLAIVKARNLFSKIPLLGSLKSYASERHPN